MFPQGITHEEMVQESKRHWQRLEQNAQKQQKVSGESVFIGCYSCEVLLGLHSLACKNAFTTFNRR